MPDEINTIEEQRLMRLQQMREKAENEAEEETGEEPKTGPGKRFINSGEAIILLAATGFVEIVQWALDFIIYLGWIVNVGISILVAIALFIWATGKVAQGAPKSWYKIIWAGAFGGAIPVIPGQLGAIIVLIALDWKWLGKIMGEKLGGKLEQLAAKKAAPV